VVIWTTNLSSHTKELLIDNKINVKNVYIVGILDTYYTYMATILLVNVFNSHG